MKKSIIIFLMILIYNGFTATFNLSAQSLIIDSLTTRLEENLHDTDRVNTLNKLAVKLMYANPDTAIILSSHALSIAKEIEWQQGIVNSNGKLGVYYYLKGDYPKALEYYFKAFKLNEELGNKKYMAANLGNIGLVHTNQGNYPKALEYYFKALKINEELGRKKGIAINLASIGIVYNVQADYPKALEYYFKSLKMDEELDRKSGIAINLGNIGNAYNEQGVASTEASAKVELLNKALEYYFKALKMNEELSRKFNISINLGNIGSVYANQGNYPNALEYFFKALKMNEELGKKNGIAINLGNIGSLYTKTGEFEKADSTLQKALTLSKEIGAKERLKYQYENLSNLYDTIGRPAQAFEAYKLYILYRDSIANEENTKAQTRTEMKYEYEKAELIAEQARIEELRIMNYELSRRDNLQYSVILIAILVLFGGVLGLGFVKVSPKVAEGLIFFAFLIVFEFVLVLADPYVDRYSGGAPGYKLLFNAGIAALIFPLHSFFETILKNRLVNKSTSELV